MAFSKPWMIHVVKEAEFVNKSELIPAWTYGLAEGLQC